MQNLTVVRRHPLLSRVEQALLSKDEKKLYLANGAFDGSLLLDLGLE